MTSAEPSSRTAQNKAANIDYGVIGNGHVAALIGRDAAVAWMCLPRLDGDPVFNGLLGGDGAFRIVLVDQVSCEQRYRRNTAVLESVLTDANGARVRVTDHCPRFRSSGRDFRPMGLVRRVEVIEGVPLLEIELSPRLDYNATAPEVETGVSHISYGGPTPFRVTTNAPVTFVTEGTPFVPRSELAFVLTQDESLRGDPVALAREWEEETLHHWRDWVKGLALPLDYQEAVVRAAITLKLCMFEETGGIVAALTTSLPEHRGSERNWDYRYNWLRDSYFSVASMLRLSEVRMCGSYARWLMSVAAGRAGETVQPLFGLGLETEIIEWIAEALPGFRDHAPVRVGNAAYDQVQNDVYGQIILCLTPLFFDTRRKTVFGADEFALLEKVGDTAFRVWDTPDAGMWEFRGFENIHTSSATFCWAACDRLAKIAAHLGQDARATHWRERADTIKAGILKRGWNPDKKSFTAKFGGEHLDASNLLMAELGFLASDHPKFVGTVEAVDRELRSGNHVFRYVDADDFGEPETAFTACTFWHIDALHRIGRREDAVAMFENLLACRNSFGLLSEDIYCKDETLWGNYPQTYCLAGIIDCARRLSRPWNTVL